MYIFRPVPGLFWPVSDSASGRILFPSIGYFPQHSKFSFGFVCVAGFRVDRCEVVRVRLCPTECNSEFVIDLCCPWFAAYVADASVLSHDGRLEFGPLVFADAEALCGGSVVLVAASVLPAGGLVVGASSFVGGEVGAAWLCAAARWCCWHVVVA